MLEGGGSSPSESSHQVETKRKIRELVRALRPTPNAATPQQAAAAQTSAACSLAGYFSRQPETRQLFLAEGGVLAALELLDAELARVAEAGLEVLRAFTASDTRLLESLCLVGLVPVVVRMAAAGGALSSSSSVSSGAAGGGVGGGGGGWQQQQQQGGVMGMQQQQQFGSGGSYTAAAPPGGGAFGSSGVSGAGAGAAAGGGSSAAAALVGGVGALGLGGPPLHSGSSAEVTHLRRKAAGFVVQLCYARETTLQMFIACGGLRCLVVMVQDNLADCNTLTPVAVACIWQVGGWVGALGRMEGEG